MFESWALASSELVTAFIGKHEARTAFRRKEAQGVIPAGEADVCWQRFCRDIQTGRIQVIPESPQLELTFGRILDQCLSLAPPLFVRTNDALHLAAAKVAGETDFVTADARPGRFATADSISAKVLMKEYALKRAGRQAIANDDPWRRRAHARRRSDRRRQLGSSTSRNSSQP